MDKVTVILLTSLLTVAVVVSVTNWKYGFGDHGDHGDHGDGVGGADRSAETCTSGMFGSDVWADWACRTQVALQRNWFPSPIAGLFSYQAWNGFDGFWQNGCVLETMVNFMAYAHHTRYETVVRSALRDLWRLLQAYYPQPSFDDMAWYALSYLRIYEVIGDAAFLSRAHEIYNWNWQQGWDKSGHCGGGMWFDQNQAFKATITNVQMLQLGAKIYRLTGSKNSTLRDAVTDTWRFIQRTNIIDNATWLLADGINLTSCFRNDNFGPTYSSGVLAGGLVDLSVIQNNQSLMDLAHRVVNATMSLKSYKGILMEWCDFNRSCNDDAKMFKGIFVRNLRYLADASNNETSLRYRKWLIANAEAVVTSDICARHVNQCHVIFKDGLPYATPTTPVFDTIWRGPYTSSAPMQQTSALDLFVSAISPATKCSSPACRYDPPIPPPRPLTCKDSPCAPGQQCCEYGGGYRTCCTLDQRCVYGSCE